MYTWKHDVSAWFSYNVTRAYYTSASYCFACSCSRAHRLRRRGYTRSYTFLWSSNITGPTFTSTFGVWIDAVEYFCSFHW